eukprot:1363044-Pleurochrysis_carterae.AAC.1
MPAGGAAVLACAVECLQQRQAVASVEECTANIAAAWTPQHACFPNWRFGALARQGHAPSEVRCGQDCMQEQCTIRVDGQTKDDGQSQQNNTEWSKQ